MTAQDIGHGHTMSYFSWAPDDLPENRALFGVPLPNVEKAGVIVYHKAKDGTDCRSAIHFDLPELAHFVHGHVWQVQSWDPLTVSPSLLCTACGDHGFIRNGRWEPA